MFRMTGSPLTREQHVRFGAKFANCRGPKAASRNLARHSRGLPRPVPRRHARLQLVFEGDKVCSCRCQNRA